MITSTALDQVAPWMVKVMVDRLQAGHPPRDLFPPLLAIIGASLTGGVLLFLQRIWVIQASRQMEYRLRRDLFGRLLAQPRAFYHGHAIGDVMSRATNDLDRIRDMVGPVILHLARMALLLVYTTVCLLRLQPGLAVMGLLPSLATPLAANIFLRRMYGLFGGIQKGLSGLNTFLQDTLSGIAVVKAYGREGEFRSKFARSSEALRDASIKVAAYNAMVWPAIGVLGSVGIILVAWVGGKQVMAGTTTLGTLSAVLLYLLRLQFPLVGLGWVASMIQRANVSIDRLLELSRAFGPGSAGDGEADAAVISAPGAPSYPHPTKAPPQAGALTVRDLSFAYGQGPKVLDGLNLEVTPGSSLGIVGPTGAGKTTFLQVVCGIFAPPPAQVFLSGKPRETFSEDAWRRHFSYAPQDGFLFSTTIRRNVEMGRRGEGLSMEEAARWADFTKDLPQIPGGYEALLGEKGINLSGGQRQRLGLARALMAEADILGLDDTLSALDAETEAQVLENLRRIRAGRTLLIVAHRYSAVRYCDRIIYLDKGRIVESGRHAELLALGGNYARIWERQRLSLSLEEA